MFVPEWRLTAGPRATPICPLFGRSESEPVESAAERPSTMNFLPGKLTRVVRPLLLILMLTVACASFAAVFISVTVGPPPLPVYVQPPCPEPGFIWIPGYWAWGPFGYYWVPGYWAEPPYAGVYWTPGYWGWDDVSVAFLWHEGYWGPHVGYYGGINYGFGYFGVGFVGGEWRGDRFFYNRAVVNINETRITNVYVNRTVIVNRTENHVSFNGPGGIQRRPTQAELVATRDRHVDPTPLQGRHRNEAERNPQFQVKNNGGKPQVAATTRPADFRSGAVPARATGGRVDTTVLNATPKNMPPPRRGAETQGRATGGETAPGGAMRGGRPETAGGGAPGRPETGRPETRGRPETNRPETGGGRPFTPSGRPETSRPETGGNRPAAPSGRPEAGRPETGGGRPSAEERRGGPPEERRGGPPERSVAPPRNEPTRQQQERPGAAASPMNERPERQAPSRPEAGPRNESRPAPQERSTRQAPQQQREAPARGNARSEQGDDKEDRGGDHGGGHGR